MSHYTLMFIILILFSCGTAEKSMKPRAKAKIADELFSQEFYWDAVRYYKDAWDADTGNVTLSYKLAEAYYFSRDYKNAQTYYGLVVAKSEMLYPLSRFKYAECMKLNGDYTNARNQFDMILKGLKKSSGGPVGTFDSDKEYKKAVQSEISGCDFALQAMNHPLNVVIENPGMAVNAGYTEAAPFLMRDSLLYFGSLRSDSVIRANDEKKYLFRIYQAPVDKNAKPGVASLLPDDVNIPGFHASNGCFSPDMKYFYFTLCRENDKSTMLCSIYRSKYENGMFGKTEKLPEAINLPDNTSTHPSIARAKGQRQVLYFSSDRPDGTGGLDIWYSVITENGSFSDPQNLGKKINTARDELTPAYDQETNTLYFSSNGHPGMGGYDIFQSEGNQRKWSDPINMGYPVNSSVDDMYYMPDKNGIGGYLVSNRPGTIALKSETCCDDIFTFRWKRGWPPKIAVEGFVYDEADPEKKYMEDVNVRLYFIDRDSSEFVVEDTKTLKDVLFFFKLNFNKNYRIYASKEGWFPGEVKLSTIGMEKSDTLHVEIPIKKLELNKSIVLKDIFYDFDKATLRPESKNTLNRLLELLYENPSIIVELSSHTDSKGDDQYNVRLSQKRAESVVKYLVKSGIQKERLVAKGYGENSPIAPNTNPDGTDNPEGRQLNRRTEIKVIGKLDATLVKEKPNIEEIMEKQE